MRGHAPPRTQADTRGSKHAVEEVEKEVKKPAESDRDKGRQKNRKTEKMGEGEMGTGEPSGLDG